MKSFLHKNLNKKIRKVIGGGHHYLHEPIFIGNEIRYLKNTILDRSVSSVGKEILKFENKIIKFTKSKYAVATVNGTSALHLCLMAIGIQRNDEVLVPAITFVGTANSVVYCGGVPHFIDCSIDNMGVDVDKLNRYLAKTLRVKKNLTINKFTKRTVKAIIPVHIFGYPCNIKEIIKIANKYNLKVIEDVAEGLGSYYKSKHLGTFGIAGCLSFNGNKIITTGGGGMVITNNKTLAKKIKHLSSTAKVAHSWEYNHNEIGYNYRMPNLNAALGLAQLEKINFFLKKKQKLHYLYRKIFKNNSDVEIFTQDKDSKSNHWLQALILKNNNYKFKNQIIKKLHKSGIFVRPVWKIIANLKPFKSFPRMNLDGSKEIYKRVINIPSGQSILIKKK